MKVLREYLSETIKSFFRSAEVRREVRRLVSSPVKSTTITLTDAQIKALPTQTIEIIPAPGAGQALFVDKWILGPLNDTGGVYTNLNNTGGSFFELVYGSGNDTDGSQTIDNISASIGTLSTGGAIVAQGLLYDDITQGISSTMINNGLFLTADNGASGNFTGGNAANTLKVTVYYVLVDV